MRIRFRWMDGSVNFVEVNPDDVATVKGNSGCDHCLLPWKDLASMWVEESPTQEQRDALWRARSEGWLAGEAAGRHNERLMSSDTGEVE